jgi:hypothetical protein
LQIPDNSVVLDWLIAIDHIANNTPTERTRQ